LKQQAVVVILGPTAVGKTDLSIRLASRLKGEIVSMDSRLIYRGMNIGTAKPTIEERQQVPHHMIDIADPDEAWSLAKFCQTALHVIEEIHHRDRLPLLVGGTGQYVTAMLEGWMPPPKPPDTSLRTELALFAESEGNEALHQRLAEVDPEAAERIHKNNLRRIIRALEIYHTTGSPASNLRKKSPPPFQSLRIGLRLPRELLYARIDTRIDEMIEAGLYEEVQKLLNEGYSPDLPSMSAIGYKQIAMAIRQAITLDEAVTEMRRLTRQFVRRQANWFKPQDPAINWFDLREEVEDPIVNYITDWLQE
jgi:tRNA dimethylallyltransferase